MLIVVGCGDCWVWLRGFLAAGVKAEQGGSWLVVVPGLFARFVECWGVGLQEISRLEGWGVGLQEFGQLIVKGVGPREFGQLGGQS